MFKVGDKVVCVNDTASSGYMSKGQTYTITGYISTLGTYQVDHKLGGFFPHRFEVLVDMTENERPFGLLSEAEQQALKDAGYGSCERFTLSGQWVDCDDWPGAKFTLASVYRLKKQPPRVKVSDLKGTVEMKDGKPNWETYTD